MAETKRIASWRLASYGQLAFPLAIADLPLDLYLQNYYGALGVALESMAVIVLIARLSDVFTDPLVGVLSDRTSRSRWGQRKSWVLAGIPIKMVGIYFLFFVTPEHATSGYLLLWLIILYLGWTMITIPFNAWGAELSNDYHERSAITGWRTWFGFSGVLIASIAPAFLLNPAAPQDLTPVMHGLGSGSLALLPISMLVLYLFVPHPPARSSTGGLTWMQGLRVAFSNGPFMRILGAGFLLRIGAAINAAAAIWFFTFVMDLKGAQVFQPIIVYLAAAVVGVPLWVALGKIWTKHRAIVAAVLWGNLSFALLLLVPKGSAALSSLVLGVAGIGGSAAIVLGLSVAADVIELDEVRSGKSRAGLLMALWGMGQKSAAAIGYFVGFMVLAGFGFDAKAGAVNEGSALTGLTLTYIVVPWIFSMSSIFLVWTFPLGPEEQRRIRAEIAARNAATP